MRFFRYNFFCKCKMALLNDCSKLSGSFKSNKAIKKFINMILNLWKNTLQALKSTTRPFFVLLICADRLVMLWKQKRSERKIYNKLHYAMVWDWDRLTRGFCPRSPSLCSWKWRFAWTFEYTTPNVCRHNNTHTKSILIHTPETDTLL